MANPKHDGGGCSASYVAEIEKLRAQVKDLTWERDAAREREEAQGRQVRELLGQPTAPLPSDAARRAASVLRAARAWAEWRVAYGGGYAHDTEQALFDAVHGYGPKSGAASNG